MNDAASPDDWAKQENGRFLRIDLWAGNFAIVKIVGDVSTERPSNFDIEVSLQNQAPRRQQIKYRLLSLQSDVVGFTETDGLTAELESQLHVKASTPQDDTASITTRRHSAKYTSADPTLVPLQINFGSQDTQRSGSLYVGPTIRRPTLTAVIRILATSLCDLIAKDPTVLRDIEWRDFERMIATALDGIGFDVQLTPPAKDGGKDVIAYCQIHNETKRFYIELKHWTAGDRPGPRHVADFVEVNIQDDTDGGLFLSSSGYTRPVFSRLTEICRERVRIGGHDKIVSLCKHYVRYNHGLWRPEKPLPQILFEQTDG